MSERPSYLNQLASLKLYTSRASFFYVAIFLLWYYMTTTHPFWGFDLEQYLCAFYGSSMGKVANRTLENLDQCLCKRFVVCITDGFVICKKKQHGPVGPFEGWKTYLEILGLQIFSSIGIFDLPEKVNERTFQ